MDQTIYNQNAPNLHGLMSTRGDFELMIQYEQGNEQWEGKVYLPPFWIFV